MVRPLYLNFKLYGKSWLGVTVSFEINKLYMVDYERTDRSCLLYASTYVMCLSTNTFKNWPSH